MKVGFGGWLFQLLSQIIMAHMFIFQVGISISRDRSSFFVVWLQTQHALVS